MLRIMRNNSSDFENKYEKIKSSFFDAGFGVRLEPNRFRTGSNNTDEHQAARFAERFARRFVAG